MSKAALVAVMALAVTACGMPPDGPSAVAPDDAPITDVPATDLPATESTEPLITAAIPAPGTDPADQYLGNTEEIYTRTFADGTIVQVRRSLANFADTFGYQWRAPTGDGSCLGDRAILLGTPGVMHSWGSAWTAVPWWSDQRDGELFGMLYTDSGQGYGLVSVGADTGSLVIDVGGPADEAPIRNGIAVVVLEPGGLRGDPISGWVVDTTGTRTPLSITMNSVWPRRQECGPGPAPQQPMPAPGRQPSDPLTTTTVRATLERIGDPDLSWDEKQLLLDDVTGVQAAAEAARRGQFSVQAQSARYSVDELVFTSPTEAWMRYTITTDAGTYSGRIGRAVSIGGQWRITRSTICNDLAFALSPCDPPPEPLVLPVDVAWQQAYQEWESRAVLYNTGDGCPPLSMC